MRDTKHLEKHSSKLAQEAKEKTLFRTQRKAVEAGAHGTLSYKIKSGKNKGNKTDDAKRTVIRGIPLQNSIKIVEIVLAMGMFDLLPKAKIIPRGKEATIPVIATTRVTSRPPQSEVST